MAVMVGLGEVLWDLFPERRLLGGAPANFAFHARQLGHDGFVASRVGSDPLGRHILEELHTRQVPTDYVQVDPDRPTGTVKVTLGPDGAPSFVITPDVAWDRLAAAPSLVGLLGRADVVCFGTLAQRCAVSRATIQSLLETTRGIKLFDINLRQDYWTAALIEAGLRQCQIAKLNEDELGVLVGLGLTGGAEDPPAACGELVRKYDLDLLALTRAARGALLVAPGRVVDHPGVRVPVVDGVGAGDAFTAAMADALLKGRTLTEVAEFANRVGAYVASQPGATPPLPAEFRQNRV
jgi:fructokinase